jgi:hypothetical protein
MRLVEELLRFIEVWEVAHQEGYDRFSDLTRVDAINLSTAEVKEIALRRRLWNPHPVRVKSAFWANNPLALGIVAMYSAFYEDLQMTPRITMGSFRKITDAAGWLGIDPDKLRH